jgi:hypothetical protein
VRARAQPARAAGAAGPRHWARRAAAATSGSAPEACRCRRRPAAAREPCRDQRERHRGSQPPAPTRFSGQAAGIPQR